MCHFYIRYQVHTGSSEDPDRGIHSCKKAVQHSLVMWNKEKGLLTVYLGCHYIVRYLGVERAPNLLWKPQGVGLKSLTGDTQPD